MYTCGPTVYNFVHIGNFRTFTFQDILRRWLRYRGYQLNHVMNVTDVDDKIIAQRRKRRINRSKSIPPSSPRRSLKMPPRFAWNSQSMSRRRPSTSA